MKCLDLELGSHYNATTFSPCKHYFASLLNFYSIYSRRIELTNTLLVRVTLLKIELKGSHQMVSVLMSQASTPSGSGRSNTSSL